MLSVVDFDVHAPTANSVTYVGLDLSLLLHVCVWNVLLILHHGLNDLSVISNLLSDCINLYPNLAHHSFSNKEISSPVKFPEKTSVPQTLEECTTSSQSLFLDFAPKSGLE